MLTVAGGTANGRNVMVTGRRLGNRVEWQLSLFRYVGAVPIPAGQISRKLSLNVTCSRLAGLCKVVELQRQHSSLARVGASVQQNDRSERATAVAGSVAVFDRRTSCTSPTGTKRAPMREATAKTLLAPHGASASDGRNPTSRSVSCKSGLTKRHSALTPKS